MMTILFQIKEINWLSGDKPSLDKNLKVQIRYNSTAVDVKQLVKKDDTVLVELFEPIKAVTPGQSAVFYRDAELLGGGIIL